MRNGSASCIDPAHAWNNAGILTDSSGTSFIRRTLGVSSTTLDTISFFANVSLFAFFIPLATFFHFDIFPLNGAIGLGIARKAGRARASGQMVDRRAVSVRSAGSEETARILATAVDTALIVGATVVSSASVDAATAFANLRIAAIVVVDAIVRWNLVASDVGISGKSGWAGTHGMVVVSGTMGSLTASFGELTGVLTLSVDASGIKFAVVVAATANHATIGFAYPSVTAVLVLYALLGWLWWNEDAIIVSVATVSVKTRT